VALIGSNGAGKSTDDDDLRQPAPAKVRSNSLAATSRGSTHDIARLKIAQSPEPPHLPAHDRF
jgi:ABC-type branched-subunit amino acid transport system ATPase component